MMQVVLIFTWVPVFLSFHVNGGDWFGWGMLSLLLVAIGNAIVAELFKHHCWLSRCEVEWAYDREAAVAYGLGDNRALRVALHAQGLFLQRGAK